jgi:CCR4-NOT transcription complex subunit 1
MMSERLGLKRVVPVALERAVAEILTPVVERSVTIACYTTVELVAKVRCRPLTRCLLVLASS